ncbi:MAG: hypothetical protein DHS20C01_29810 [marine bacterium B5-7]|nr:MAG: hypothetical protein DHS20C01_29810 [marine bacterium B5-7]
MSRSAITLALFFSLLIPVNGFASSLINGLPVPSVQYPIQNLRHDTVLTLDENGTIITRRAYGNYGESDPDNSSGVDTLRYKFTGQELDTTTGLYYFNARYYSPTIKRFLSPDPAKQDSSPYVYAADRPQQFIDPTGLAWEDTVLPEFTRNEHLIISDLHAEKEYKNSIYDVSRRFNLRHLEFTNDGSPLVFYDGKRLYRSSATNAINIDYPRGVSLVIFDHGQWTQRRVGASPLEEFFSRVQVNACIDLGCRFGQNRSIIESLAKDLGAPVISSTLPTYHLNETTLIGLTYFLTEYAAHTPDNREEAFALLERFVKTASFTIHHSSETRNFNGFNALVSQLMPQAIMDINNGNITKIVNGAAEIINFFRGVNFDKWQRTTY